MRTGDTVGPYRVLDRLGAGGMGEVYRAHDPRLHRDVAIKVLPEWARADPARLRRFADEARAAGALGHPGILVVHDVGRHGDSPYLVSELLDGQTLRDYLDETGAIPPRKALDWAVQIAHGLAAAHAKGIVHRDLKPSNLFLTRDGRLKILDFGLAKLSEAASDEATVTVDRRTGSGVTLGTIGYMAPEQVRGETAGPRADIFALGIVICEMLTAEAPFARGTSAETLTAILRDDPPNLPASVPPALERLVRRCLEKRPEDRFHSAHDLALAIEALSLSRPSAAIPDRSLSQHAVEGVSATGVTGLHRTNPRVWLHGVAVGAVMAAAMVLTVVGGAWLGGGEGPPTPPVHMTVLLPAGVSVASGPGVHLPIAVSPDGRTIVVAGSDAKGNRLYRRSVDRPEVTPLAGTEGGLAPFFSPDGEWVGFSRTSG